MNKCISLRWQAWYGDRDQSLQFPNTWQAKQFNPVGGEDIGEKGLRRAFANPIGTSPIAQLAQGKRNAVVVIDDLTRPTPGRRLLPLVIEELVKGGISERTFASF